MPGQWGMSLSPGTSQAGPTFLRPFSADSMWNTPVSTLISGGAYYGRGGDGGAGTKPNFASIPQTGGQGIWVDIVYLLDSAAGVNNGTLYWDPPWPQRAPSGPGAGGTVVNSGRTIILPNGYYVQSAAGSGVSTANAAGAYLDENDTVHSTGVPTWWQGNGFCCDNNAGAGNLTPAFGTSVFNSATACADTQNTKRGNLGGRGASGLSSVGGCLRPGELESVVNFPQHALSFTFPMGLYGRQDVPFTPSNATNWGWSSSTSNGTGGFVWPAIAQDSGFNSGSAGVGNNYGGAAFGTPWLWMGSLLAIKPSELSTVLSGLPHGTQIGKNFANTMAQFGGYASENASSAASFVTFGFQADTGACATLPFHGAGGTFDQNACDDVNFVFQNLYVVMKPNQLAPN